MCQEQFFFLYITQELSTWCGIYKGINLTWQDLKKTEKELQKGLLMTSESVLFPASHGSIVIIEE